MDDGEIKAVRCGDGSVTIEKMGRFMMPFRQVQNQPAKIAAIFAYMWFVPFRAEIIDFGNNIAYDGLSRLFRELPHDEVVPHYQITAEFSETGELLSLLAEEVG
ncbi:MAG: hypothetical protein NT047_00780 [Deltaproteobacteria bacterium]|nr:hypothetical protein [Deltaproteobacteria bacterium]